MPGSVEIFAIVKMISNSRVIDYLCKAINSIADTQLYFIHVVIVLI